MGLKTKVKAESGRQDLIILRDFDIPVKQLFKAYIDPEIVSYWMGTKVLKLISKPHGSYEFETTDPFGNKHIFNGVIHEIEEDKKITRTFKMASFPVQLEYLEFNAINEHSSSLAMHVVYKSNKIRDQLLQLPFAQGINMAHNRIEEYYN